MADQEEGFDFFDDLDDVGGIFRNRNNPPGAYGDPDAIEDLQAEEAAVPIQGLVQDDGLAAPAPHMDMMAALTSPVVVDMVCLAGPCRHYTEAVLAEGGLHRTIRRCDRICTWAEQLKLDDANVLGCSHHEPEAAMHPRVEARVLEGRAAVEEGNRGQQLGICHEASCEHYVNMVVDTGEEIKIERWCLKLGGAAKPYKFAPEFPMLACTAVRPGRPHDALARGRALLAAERAKRPDKTPREDEE